jgi:hypothetical protein
MRFNTKHQCSEKLTWFRYFYGRCSALSRASQTLRLSGQAQSTNRHQLSSAIRTHSRPFGRNRGNLFSGTIKATMNWLICSIAGIYLKDGTDYGVVLESSQQVSARCYHHFFASHIVNTLFISG